MKRRILWLGQPLAVEQWDKVKWSGIGSGQCSQARFELNAFFKSLNNHHTQCWVQTHSISKTGKKMALNDVIIIHMNRYATRRNQIDLFAVYKSYAPLIANRNSTSSSHHSYLCAFDLISVCQSIVVIFAIVIGVPLRLKKIK